jgi:hypothetical protein
MFLLFGSIWGVGLPIFRHIWVFFGDHPHGTSEWWQKGRWIWYLKMWLKTWNLFETLPLGVDTSLGITLWMLNPDLCFKFVSIILYIYIIRRSIWFYVQLIGFQNVQRSSQTDLCKIWERVQSHYQIPTSDCFVFGFEDVLPQSCGDGRWVMAVQRNRADWKMIYL